MCVECFVNVVKDHKGTVGLKLWNAKISLHWCSLLAVVEQQMARESNLTNVAIFFSY